MDGYSLWLVVVGRPWHACALALLRDLQASMRMHVNSHPACMAGACCMAKTCHHDLHLQKGLLLVENFVGSADVHEQE